MNEPSPKPQRLSKYEMHWGTWHPKYNLINTAEPTRKRAIEAFCGSTKNWKYWYRQGWRAIRIKIVPLDYASHSDFQSATKATPSDAPGSDEPLRTEKVLELLKELEWSGFHTDYEDSWSTMTIACPSCFNAKEDGHKENCKLAAELRRGKEKEP